MKINILYLYGDLMNLYGECGNIKALYNYFTKQGIDTKVIEKSILDDLDFKDIDIIYMGCGMESSQLLALEHLMKYKTNLKKYIDNDKYIIATGNSFELFGKKFYNNEDLVDGLGFFEFDNEKIDRVVSEGIFKCSLFDGDIVGFQNHNNIIKCENYLFENTKFKGYETKYDGFNYKNFYGTYLLGPILARNPNFLCYVCDNIIKSKDSKFKIKKLDFSLEEKAYEEFIKNYY